MSGKLMLAELLLAGFFAIACIRAHGPVATGERITFGELFRFPDRLDRLRRSRLQGVSVVALMLVLRLQEVFPLCLEVMVDLEVAVVLTLLARDTVGSY